MALFLTHNEPPEITNFQTIRPGPVGAVGDVNMLPRLRTSCAALLPVRFDAKDKVQEPLFGANVTDGQVKGYEDKGGPARVYDSMWSGRKKRKAIGAKFQDLRAPDKSIEPIVVGSNQYSWKNSVATVVNAKTTGNKFLPLPGAYVPNSLTRGGLYPRITDIGGDGIVAGGQSGGTDGVKKPEEPVYCKPGELSIMGTCIPQPPPTGDKWCRYNPSQKQWEGPGCPPGTSTPVVQPPAGSRRSNRCGENMTMCRGR